MVVVAITDFNLFSLNTSDIPFKLYKPMTQVIVNRDEQIEYTLRRFKRKVSQAGIFIDLKKNRSFETPAQKLKRKQLARHKQRRRYNKYKTF